MTENKAIIDYNTIKENLEMERLQHEIEIKALEGKLRVAIKELKAIRNTYIYNNVTVCNIDQALELITKEY